MPNKHIKPKPSGTSLQANALLTPSPSRQVPSSPLVGKSLETTVSSALNPAVMMELEIAMMLAASQLEPLLTRNAESTCHCQLSAVMMQLSAVMMQLSAVIIV